MSIGREACKQVKHPNDIGPGTISPHPIRNKDMEFVKMTSEAYDATRQVIVDLQAEIEQLKSNHAKAIEAAYVEGRHDATCSGGRYWEISNACASLHKESK